MCTNKAFSDMLNFNITYRFLSIRYFDLIIILANANLPADLNLIN